MMFLTGRPPGGGPTQGLDGLASFPVQRERVVAICRMAPRLLRPWHGVILGAERLSVTFRDINHSGRKIPVKRFHPQSNAARVVESRCVDSSAPTHVSLLAVADRAE